MWLLPKGANVCCVTCEQSSLYFYKILNHSVVDAARDVFTLPLNMIEGNPSVSREDTGFMNRLIKQCLVLSKQKSGATKAKRHASDQSHFSLTSHLRPFVATGN